MLPANILNLIAVDEEEELEAIRNFNLERRHMRDTSDPFSLVDSHFIDLFRLNKDMVRYVLNGILPDLNQTNNVVAIPPVLKVFGTLNFYATGSYQRTIGQSFNISMSQQSLSKAIQEVTLSIINRFAEEWIRFPRSMQSKNQIKARFMEVRNFPGVVGCVDGTHVALLCPKEEEHNYYNRKGFHSKNVQIVIKKYN